jgi:PAS domain S-box-containing protein
MGKGNGKEKFAAFRWRRRGGSSQGPIWMAVGLLVLLIAAFPALLRPAVGGGPTEILTPEERSWLLSQPHIRLAPEYGYAPFSYRDGDGKLKGISLDCLRLLEQKLGVTFQTGEGGTLRSILERVREGRADVLTSLMKTPERAQYLLFTTPYITVPTVMISRKDVPGPDRLEEMGSRTIAVGDGYAVASYLKNAYPGLRLIPAKDDTVCLRMLSFGEVDAAVMDMASASHIIDHLKITNLRIAGDAGFLYKLCFASRKDLPMLNRILEKGVSAISPSEREAVYNRWVTHGYHAPFFSKKWWIIINSALAFFVLATTGVILWNKTLRATVHRKTFRLREELAHRKEMEEALQKAHDLLEIRVKERTAQLRGEVEDRRKSQRELAESEEKYRLLFENANDAIYIHDEQGRILEVNKVACDLLGHTREAFLSMSVGQVDAVDEAAQVEKRIRDILETGRLIFQTVHQTKDGQPIPVEVSSRQITWNGQPAMLSICRDITEHRRALEGAEAANRAKSAFLANMGHEIRTPMTGILGMAGLLLETALTDRQRGFAEKILASGESLLAILNDILDFSKIESGKLTLKRIPFSLEEVVENALAVSRQKTAEKGLRFRIHIDPGIPTPLLGDPLRLTQVIGNLTDNAVKFTQAGEIGLLVTLLEETAGDFKLKISVQDTGIGIHAEALSGLFSPFSQADESAARHYGGTGLGLAITHNLVVLMGGTLEVESAPGAGSAFSVVLPFRRAEVNLGNTTPNPELGGEGARAGAVPHPSEPAKETEFLPEGFVNVRALVAEDDDINRELMVETLARLGIASDEAANGLEAVEMVRGGTYDIVLMDVEMPHLDGLAAAERIRGSEGKRGDQTVILAMTAHASPEDREKSLVAGMNDHLNKPVRRSDLITVLARWIPREKQVETSRAPDRPAPGDPVRSTRGDPAEMEGALERLRKALASEEPLPCKAILEDLARQKWPEAQETFLARLTHLIHQYRMEEALDLVNGPFRTLSVVRPGNGKTGV